MRRKTTSANCETFTPQDNSAHTSIHLKGLHGHTSLVYKFDLDNCGTSDWNVSGSLASRMNLARNLGFFLMTWPSALSIKDTICLTDAGSSIRPRRTTIWRTYQWKYKKEQTDDPCMTGRETSKVMTLAKNVEHMVIGLSIWQTTSPALL